MTITSPDKDFLQLLRPQVRLLRRYEQVQVQGQGQGQGQGGSGGAPDAPASSAAAAGAAQGGGGGGGGGGYARQQPVFYTAHDFETEYGLQPPQWVEVLALWGDASDNVRGVEGLGAKGALQLVREHGSVEAAIAAASALAQQQQELQEQQEAAGGAGSGKGRGKGAAKGGAGAAGGKLALLASAEAQVAARLSRELVQIRADLRLPSLEQLDVLQATRLAVPADGGARAVHHLGGQLGLEREAQSLARLYERLGAAARASGAAVNGAAAAAAAAEAGEPALVQAMGLQ